MAAFLFLKKVNVYFFNSIYLNRIECVTPALSEGNQSFSLSNFPDNKFRNVINVNVSALRFLFISSFDHKYGSSVNKVPEKIRKFISQERHNIILI